MQKFRAEAGLPELFKLRNSQRWIGDLTAAFGSSVRPKP